MRNLPWRARTAAGGIIWLALIGAGLARLPGSLEGRRSQAASDLGAFFFGRGLPVVLRFPEDVEIAVGDPLYHLESGGTLSPIGEVRALRVRGAPSALRWAFPGGGVSEVECSIQPGSPGGIVEGARARLHQVPQNMSWVVRTLLPPEKMASIARQWNEALLENRDEIFRALAPAMRRALREIQGALAAELPAILQAHRDELALSGKRLFGEFLEKEFQPILETELWPLIEQRTRPALEAVTGELWLRVPLWGITWRAVYQTLPFTSDSHVKEELDRFWKEEAVPILRAHAGDFLQIAGDAVKEATRNERLGQAFRNGFDSFLQDEGLQHTIRLIFQEAVLDNPRFQQSMYDLWDSPEVTAAIDSLAPRIGPVLRRIGEEVLGTPSGGITPEFARVLRTQILQKDRRWIVIECPAAAQGTPRAAVAPGTVIPAQVERP